MRITAFNASPRGSREDTRKSKSTWKSFKENFPWGAVALIWCVGVFYIHQLRTHKANFFAVFAVIMIIARIIVVIAQKDPRMYLYVLALVLLKAYNLSIVGLIDMLASWPLVVVLFIFTLKFPAWYWKNNYAKIKAG
jgi:hypothetical protein